MFKLPAGWHLGRAPARRHEDTAFGSFDLQFVSGQGGRVLTVRSTIDVRQHRVPPDQYSAFRVFLRAIDAALDERIVLQKDEG